MKYLFFHFRGVGKRDKYWANLNTVVCVVVEIFVKV